MQSGLRTDLTQKYKVQLIKSQSGVRDDLAFNCQYPILLIKHPRPVCAAIRAEKDECVLLSSLCWDIQHLMKYSACVYCH